ncbi:hypothetical protein FW781_17615 [Chryseobacterium panacisoli]|uniref:Uncharacterized protein n=1 Tax=Chryseobacterium panacisoli TaxID=1807141 RepID=A0A5D8ZHN5_9FLAO|nr:hypothetical protein [Chryseobacterium panacisoli]TZF93512.1 hypothetical protein FW781_17615 [Chryseobacterium panacisoli]
MKKLNLIVVFLSTMALGQVGINTGIPTEVLDVNGIERIRELPKHQMANAIFTKPDGTKSVNKDQTFTAVKTVVADANGVLGYLDGLPKSGTDPGLPVGEAITRIYTVPAVTAQTSTFNLKTYIIANNLPGLPSIDGLEMNLQGTADPSYYDPRIYNISGSPLLVSYQSFATVGNENETSLNNNLLPGAYLQIDYNNIVFWTTANAEVETTNLQVQIDSNTYRWYEFKWWCMQVSGEKKIFMSVTRKA